MIYNKPICPSIFLKWGLRFSVICSPYYLLQSDIGFYPQYPHPKVLLPGGMIRRRPRTEKLEKSRSAFGDGGYNTAHQEYDTSMHTAGSSTTINSQETLPLFPLHPTGILQGESGKSSIGSSEVDQECSGDQLFFDFFPGEGSCESYGN